MFPHSPLFSGRSQLLRLVLLSLFLLIGFADQPRSLAQQTGSATCSALVEQAIQEVHAACATGSRNQACYGHGRIEAEVRADSPESFAAPGDVTALNNLVRLATLPLDEDTSEWGIALMTVQANLPETMPGQNVTFLLLGDVEVTDASSDDTVLSKAGTMQAFYFKSGLNQAFACKEAPYGALALQNTRGTQVTLSINGVEVKLGSTAALFAQPFGTMQVLTVEGEATLTADGVTQVVPAGQMSTVPLGGANGLEASGPPSDPQPYARSQVGNIPFELLPEAVNLSGDLAATPLLVNIEYTGAAEGSTAGVCQPGAPVDAVLAFDLSKTMYGVPVAALKSAAARFIDQLDPASDRVSVVYFSSDMQGFPEEVKVLYPFGSHFSEAKSLISTVDGLCTTNLDRGLLTSHELISANGRADSCQAIVLVSDGMANITEHEATLLRSLAEEIKADGIHLMTAAVSGTSETMWTVDTDPEYMGLVFNTLPYLPMSTTDRNLMAALASSPADAIYVPMPGELGNALEHLARRLTSAQAATDVVFTYSLNTDAYTFVPGSAPFSEMIDDHTIQWQMPAISAGEPVVLPLAVHALKTGQEPVGEGEVSGLITDGQTMTESLVSRILPPTGDILQYGADNLLTIGATATGTLGAYETHRWMADTPARQLFSVTVEGAASQYPPQMVDSQFEPVFPLYWLTTPTGTTSVFYVTEAGAKWLYLNSTAPENAGTYTLRLLDGAVDQPEATLTADGEPFTDQQNQFEGRTYALEAGEGDIVTVKALTDSYYMGEDGSGPVLVYAVSLSDGQLAEKMPLDVSLDSQMKAEGDVFSVLHLRGSGPYRLVVINQVRGEGMPKQLEYTLEISPSDVTRANKGVLTPGQTISGNGVATQTSQYTIDGLQSRVFSLSLNYDINSGAQVQLEVTDAGQNWIECESHFVDDGEVYVCSPSFAAAPYQLKITPSGDFSLTLNDGNVLTSSQTEVLKVGDSLDVNTILYEYLYTLDAQPDEAVTITVSQPYLYFELMSAEGWPMDGRDVGDEDVETSQTFTLTGSGPYLLTIYDTFPPFTISVEAAEATPVEAGVPEINIPGMPQPEDGGMIGFCQFVTIEPISAAFGFVRYQFEAEAGKIVTVYVTDAGMATVYDASGNPLASGSTVMDFDDNFSMYSLSLYVLSGPGPYTLEFMTGAQMPAFEAVVLEGAQENIPKSGPVCEASAPSNEQTDEQTESPGDVVDVSGGILIRVTANSANLRGGAGKDFNVVGTAAAGDQFTAVGRNAAGDWYQIALTDGSSGWIFQQLIVPADGSSDLLVLPVMP